MRLALPPGSAATAADTSTWTTIYEAYSGNREEKES